MCIKLIENATVLFTLKNETFYEVNKIEGDDSIAQKAFTLSEQLNSLTEIQTMKDFSLYLQ